MFGFGKKKKELAILAPCDGRMIDVTEVPDEVFASRMMGDGMAVWQESAEVCAPCDGTLSMVADTKHAFGITTKDGLEILVHVGLETVTLGGEGFEVFHRQGETVKAGDVVFKVDLELMKAKNIKMAVPVILISNDEEHSLAKAPTGAAKHNETVLFQVK